LNILTELSEGGTLKGKIEFCWNPYIHLLVSALF